MSEKEKDLFEEAIEEIDKLKESLEDVTNQLDLIFEKYSEIVEPSKEENRFKGLRKNQRKELAERLIAEKYPKFKNILDKVSEFYDILDEALKSKHDDLDSLEQEIDEIVELEQELEEKRDNLK